MEIEMDEMTCLCGEILRGEKGKGEIAKQYDQHMMREDHKASPAQWGEAYRRIESAKERAKKQQSA